MKAVSMRNELGTRAKQALKAALQQVSTVEVKGMEMIPESGREMDMVVRVSVLGRNHTLACKVVSSSEPRLVRKALRELQENAAELCGNATPVFIAPYLSPEAQALCLESETGFVDLEDNARLLLCEVFIAKRALGRQHAEAPEMPVQAAEIADTLRYRPARVDVPAVVCPTAA